MRSMLKNVGSGLKGGNLYGASKIKAQKLMYLTLTVKPSVASRFSHAECYSNQRLEVEWLEKEARSNC